VPVLHLIVGPNGAGKTTFFERLLLPITHLPFINADILARQHWPGDEEAHGHDAAAMAEEMRRQAIARRQSFAAETVFSHPSKLDLLQGAKSAGYLIQMHVILVPEDLSVLRVRLRHRQGGHAVPETKIRERYQRLWSLVERALPIVDEAWIYDNSAPGNPYRLVAQYAHGRLLGSASYPAWSPLKAP
jgi:predicted ABC-type ATPase